MALLYIFEHTLDRPLLARKTFVHLKMGVLCVSRDPSIFSAFHVLLPLSLQSSIYSILYILFLPSLFSVSVVGVCEDVRPREQMLRPEDRYDSPPVVPYNQVWRGNKKNF